ncbi:hypothetical protein [Bartonella gabonensis]|uniref:hypothetical protein n=1 Tax=Bartonella gabonensis TaxID=2699889 RepID=UPI001FE48C85|nr:hypothetical protein [Bartonella gabonensis]
MAQSVSSMRQTQKDFQETILQTSHTAINDQISVQRTKETHSDHQERANQRTQKAMAYWDTGTKTMDTTPSESLSSELKEERIPEKITIFKMGAAASFTAPSAQHQQEVLIPAEKNSPPYKQRNCHKDKK